MKPLLVATGLVVLFAGMLVNWWVVGVGGVTLFGGLYWWLLTPLEEHH
jgi:hypothetical protein